MTTDEIIEYFMDSEKFPYKQLGINDVENTEIKELMRLSCVAFIDILGFSNMVDKNIDKVILALRYVKLFRDSYCRLPSTNYVGEFTDIFPEATMFSDSIVLSHTIDEDFDFYSFVLYIAELQMELLKNGIIVRGGIEIGNLYHDKFFVFGDGLIAAFKLEHDRAIYPRILVGKKLLSKIEKQFDERFENELRYNGAPKNWRDYENEELEFISQDIDGLKYINYLKHGMHLLDAHDTRKNEWDDKMELAEYFYESTLKYIIDFIKEELAKNNAGVREKYIWLKNLYNRTLDIFVNRAHGGQAEKYKMRWANRFIEEPNSERVKLPKSFPEVFVGDLVLIKSCGENKLERYIVDRILIDKLSFQSGKYFFNFRDITAIYRFADIELKCIWEKADNVNDKASA